MVNNMSIELITELYNRRSVDAKLQRVLLCLCDAANDSGVCWPSIGRIAWKLECSDATVQRAIRDLKDMQVVTVSTRDGHSNVYRVDLSKLPKKEPYQAPISTPLQNDTPLQTDTPRGLQTDTPTPLQNEGGGPLQNDTHNRKGNHKNEPSIEPSVNHHTESDTEREYQQAVFDKWYDAYPRKVRKADARKAFAKVIKTIPLTTLIEAVENQKQGEQWRDPKYIPHPATWLNREGWEDEVIPAKPTAPSRAQFNDPQKYSREQVMLDIANMKAGR